MKKILIILMAAMLVFTGCSKQEQLETLIETNTEVKPDDQMTEEAVEEIEEDLKN